MDNYNSFCKEKKCPNFKQWEYYGEDLKSCTLVGNSKDIIEYPDECLFIEEIKKLKLKPKANKTMKPPETAPAGKNMNNTFICAACKGEFKYGWSEEEALEEKNNNFGDIEGFPKKEDCDIVCDDCYKKMGFDE